MGAPKTVAYPKRGEQSEIGSKTTTEPELDLASEENENMHEAQMFSISIVGNSDNEADSTMTKVSSTQENAKNHGLEIATMQIEKGLAESSLDFIIEQVAKLDSIEALKNLQNRYAICSVTF